MHCTALTGKRLTACWAAHLNRIMPWPWRLPGKPKASYTSFEFWTLWVEYACPGAPCGSITNAAIWVAVCGTPLLCAAAKACTSLAIMGTRVGSALKILAAVSQLKSQWWRALQSGLRQC